MFVVLVFGFKGLIPQGYMLATVDGHTRLVICPAGIHYAADRHSMPGMVHSSNIDHIAHASLAAAQCPFALASGAAFHAAVAVPAAPDFVVLQPARFCETASLPITPPLRYHAPRGPPTLA